MPLFVLGQQAAPGAILRFHHVGRGGGGCSTFQSLTLLVVFGAQPAIAVVFAYGLGLTLGPTTAALLVGFVSFVALKLCHRFFFGAGGLARRVAYGLDSSVMMFTFLAGVQVTTALLADGRDEQPIWLVCATLVFVCGSALEMTADQQLANFVRAKQARAASGGEGGEGGGPRVMTKGAWSVSRHPNQ